MHKLRLAFFFSILFFFGCLTAVSQSDEKKITGGIFSSYENFMKNEYSIVTQKGNGRLVKNNLTEAIKIKTKDSTYHYALGSIYGYFDGRDKYRFFKSTENSLYSGYFKIKEVGQFIVYEKVIYHKATKGSKLKGPVRHVFFSKEFNSAIKELNFNNLTEEFKNVPEILYFVNKVGAKCNSCLTKKTKKGYNITNQINKYNQQRADSIKLRL